MSLVVPYTLLQSIEYISRENESLSLVLRLYQ